MNYDSELTNVMSSELSTLRRRATEAERQLEERWNEYQQVGVVMLFTSVSMKSLKFLTGSSTNENTIDLLPLLLPFRSRLPLRSRNEFPSAWIKYYPPMSRPHPPWT